MSFCAPYPLEEEIVCDLGEGHNSTSLYIPVKLRLFLTQTIDLRSLFSICAYFFHILHL